MVVEMNILNKIKNLIKFGLLKNLKDEDQDQIAKTEYMGVEQEGILYNPYGFYSKPVNGSRCLIHNVGGSENSQVVYAWNPKNRPSIENGESALWNEKSKCGVYVRNDGTIEIDNKKRNVKIKEDSIVIENKDSLPIGDINWGTQGILDMVKNWRGVGNLSIPVPADPATIAIIEKMLTESKLEIK